MFSVSGTRIFIAAICCVLGAQAGMAQPRRVDCAPPRGVSGADEVASIIADGEADCVRAQNMMRENLEWRRTAENLRKESERFRRTAGEMRKEADRLRREVEDYRDRITDLRVEMAQLNERLRSGEHAVTTIEPNDGAFRGGSDSTIFIPIPGGSQWDDRIDQYARARARFIEVRLNSADEEIMALEGMTQVNEELAADKEATAVDLEQLAINNERTALEADATAALAEEAALIAERSAILHHLHASTQFIALNLGNAGAKRNVGRAVGYIDKYKHLMSGLDAREADRVVAEARTLFDL